jgi:hypothetical protein
VTAHYRTPRERRIERAAKLAEQGRCIRILRSFFELKDPDDRARLYEIVGAIVKRTRTTQARNK